MDLHKKQILSLVCLCAVCSVLVSVLAVGLILKFNTNGTGTEVNQTATQTITINERSPDEPKKININTATTYELQTLPGVGPIMAQKIIYNRPYTDVWEIAEIEGIGIKTLRNIIDRIEV